MVWLYSLISVFIVSLVSLIGIFTLSINREKLEKIVQFLVSFAVGALFGDVFIHLLPEIFEEGGTNLATSLLVLAGILIFFIIEKVIYWRHCHEINCERHPQILATMNLVGDGLHNFLDGIIIAVSYLVSLPLGLATFLAVVLHEIPQEIGDFGILLHAGLSTKKALFFNFLSALAAVLGTVFSLVFGARIEGYSFFLLPITAGGFIYIAGSDLIPELHNEVKLSTSLKQLVAIILGISIMALLVLLE